MKQDNTMGAYASYSRMENNIIRPNSIGSAGKYGFKT